MGVDRELGANISPSESIKVKVSDAKGPKLGGNSYWLCSECNKVVYSVWRDGPLADETRNRVFCICDGEQDMANQEQVVTVLELEDVTSKHEAKEFRKWLNNQKK